MTTTTQSLQQDVEAAVEAFLGNVSKETAFMAHQLLDQLAELAELNEQDCLVLGLAVSTLEAADEEAE